MKVFAGGQDKAVLTEVAGWSPAAPLYRPGKLPMEFDLLGQDFSLRHHDGLLKESHCLI